MRGAWLVPVALCVLLAGCSQQSSPQPSTNTRQQGAGLAQQNSGVAQAGTSPADPAPVPNMVGTWTSDSTMNAGGMSIPAHTTAIFKADGTVSVDSKSDDAGELFSASGTWQLLADGKTMRAKLEDTPSVGTLQGNQLVWLNLTWTRH
jgi:hypothetical protein